MSVECSDGSNNQWVAFYGDRLYLLLDRIDKLRQPGEIKILSNVAFHVYLELKRLGWNGMVTDISGSAQEDSTAQQLAGWPVINESIQLERHNKFLDRSIRLRALWEEISGHSPLRWGAEDNIRSLDLMLLGRLSNEAIDLGRSGDLAKISKLYVRIGKIRQGNSHNY